MRFSGSYAKPPTVFRDGFQRFTCSFQGVTYSHPALPTPHAPQPLPHVERVMAWPPCARCVANFYLDGRVENPVAPLSSSLVSRSRYSSFSPLPI